MNSLVVRVAGWQGEWIMLGRMAVRLYGLYSLKAFKKGGACLEDLSSLGSFILSVSLTALLPVVFCRISVGCWVW